MMSMPNIVQSTPGGVAAIQVEHIGIPISSLPLDGVVVRQERVSQKSSETNKGTIKMLGINNQYILPFFFLFVP